MKPRTELQQIEADILTWEEVERFELAERLSSVEITVIKIKKEHQNRGVGTRAFALLKEYAEKNGVALWLSPDPFELGKKAALERFYRRQGFRPNKGKHFRPQYGGMSCSGWYWEPRVRVKQLELLVEKP